MTRGERIRLAMRAAGLKQPQVAEALGVSQSYVSQVVNDVEPADSRLDQLAGILKVQVEWLRVGANPPAWAEPEAPAAVPALPLQGMVSAGPGDIDQWAETAGALRLSPHWCAVKVDGDSAYPVVYPGQYAVIDEGRAVRPAALDERAGWDLDDDVVLVRLVDGGAMLKRFCFHPPGSFVLASVNGGRRSPLVSPEDIDAIIPVVGVIYLDPQLDRSNRWREKRDGRTRPKKSPSSGG